MEMSPHYNALTEEAFKPAEFVMDVDQSFLDALDAAEVEVRKRYEAQAELDQMAIAHDRDDRD